MLEGLDDVPWDQLQHAYGAASDVPGILRDIARGDAEAVDALYGNVWHQGTVYEATAPTVPFLVQLLEVSGPSRVPLLHLLGLIAEGSAFARAAVRAQAPGILRCLTVDDDEVRAAAASALSVCRGDPAVDDALRQHLAVDPSGVVRASLLLALRPCRASDRDGAEASTKDGEAIVRLAASMLLLTSEGEASRALDTLRDALPTAHAQVRALPHSEGRDPIPWILDALAPRREELLDLLEAWTRDASPAVRRDAVFACEELMLRSRSATPRVVGVLASALEDRDGDVRRWAATHLAACGTSARPAADALASLVARRRRGASSETHDALRALCLLEDPRATLHVAERLKAKSIAWTTIPIDALGPWAPSCMDPLIDALPRAPAGNTTIGVVCAIGRYGDEARRAIPSLVRALRSHPHSVTKVLGELGPLAQQAMGALRPLLDHEDAIVRVNTAVALWRMGEPVEIALRTIESILRPLDWYASHALLALATLGPAGAPLAPALPALFDSDDDWISSRAAIAHWRIVGDADAVLPTLARHVVCVPRGHEALACIEDLGPRAASLAPRLREQLSGEQRRGQSVASDEAWRAVCARALERVTART